MTVRMMIFVDGTWLYLNRKGLSQEYGTDDFSIDFGKLPGVLGEEVLKQMHTSDVDIIRTYLFGSYAQNYAPNPRDDLSVERQQRFFEMLRQEFHYEVEVYPTDFQGRPLRRGDRDVSDPWEPKEKCVDIALATTMMYFAAVPNAYDVAIAVIGDRDFVPVLQTIRRLGKRVAIASIRGSCPREFADVRDEARVKDFDIIWLNDLLERLELSRSLELRHCQDPNHEGDDRTFYTTYHPRKGEPVYCDACRDRHRARRSMGGFSEQQGTPFAEQGTYYPVGSILRGIVKVKHPHDSYGYYGFIEAEDGNDYYFNPYDLAPEVNIRDLEVGSDVRFEVKRVRTADKQGAAQAVMPADDAASDRFGVQLDEAGE